MRAIKIVRRGKYSSNRLQPNKQVNCSKCNKSYKRRAILAHHIRSKHLNYHVVCPVCNKQFISISNCNRHLKKVHKIEKYSAFNLQFKTDPVEVNIDDNAPPILRTTLALKENGKFGKHLVAECELDVGEVVLSEDAIATLDLVMSIGSNCFNCGKERNCNFIECPHCINVQFCSKRCSSTEYHQSKCDRMFNRNDCHIVRLTTGIILAALNSVSNIETMLEFLRGILFSNKKTKNCRPPFSQYGELLQLKGKEEKKHFSIAKRVCNLLMLSPQTKSVKPQELKRIVYHCAVRYASCIEINTFCEEFKVCKGGICKNFSIYSTISRLNHSCSPNLHQYVDDNQIMHCVAVRPIKKGDQVFINYLTGSEPKPIQNRQSYLKENWDFDCNCDKCMPNFSVGNENDDSYQYIKRNFTKRTINRAIRLQQECVQYLRKFGFSWSTSVEFVVNCLIVLINES